ncbi:Ribulokinase-like protein [Yamadazyma tenuis]|uniref:Ribulokinase-like protein n=1 Tax=Candida tenuis TaxID=2315449 RepID=UPI0027A95570|nr:Ribulokinase-like protein [Yamadazyma tenuis]
MNKQLEGSFMKQTIGEFIPELGLPKLKWLSDNSEKELYCFELYDWFSYVFQVGYYDKSQNLVEFALRDVDFTHGTAIDGSIKGWSREQLSFIGGNVKVGRSETVGPLDHVPSQLLPLGAPIGRAHPDLLADCHIFNGCIDCYGGWALTACPRQISMVAGTSTCFMFHTKAPAPLIPAVWGPFELVSQTAVYSFGQPATGKLFEDLFDEFSVGRDSFARMETITQEWELEHHQSIIELVRHYVYYGDKYGNRSPLSDFRMDECFIDGKNASVLGVSVFSQDEAAMVIRRLRCLNLCRWIPLL